MKSSMTQATHKGMIIKHARFSRKNSGQASRPAVRDKLWPLKNNNKQMKTTVLTFVFGLLLFSCMETDDLSALTSGL
jgi:hypothetical protein